MRITSPMHCHSVAPHAFFFDKWPFPRDIRTFEGENAVVRQIGFDDSRPFPQRICEGRIFEIVVAVVVSIFLLIVSYLHLQSDALQASMFDTFALQEISFARPSFMGLILDNCLFRRRTGRTDPARYLETQHLWRWGAMAPLLFSIIMMCCFRLIFFWRVVGETAMYVGWMWHSRSRPAAHTSRSKSQMGSASCGKSALARRWAIFHLFIYAPSEILHSGQIHHLISNPDQSKVSR